MDPVVTVDSDSVNVEPGGQASVTVRVRNVSSIVEGFRIDVLGEASPWARVLPDHLEVLPQGEGIATVLFSPPSGVAARAGAVPFGVRATSQIDANASAVAEGDLAVGGLSLSQAKITPVTSKGRFSAKHRVEFSNWGNTPVRLRLEAGDPDNALGFLVTPEFLDLPLGTSGQAKVKVRARKPQFRGTPLRRTFRVVGRPLLPGQFEPAPGPAPQPYGYDPSQPAVDGAFEQRPIIGRGLIPLAIVAVMAAGAIGFLTSRNRDDAAEENVAPPAPTGLTVSALGPDTARLNWQPGERVDSYTAYTIDPATKDAPIPTATNVQQEIPGDQGQVDVPSLAPGTEQCFQLSAVRGEAISARTAPECLTMPAIAPPGEVAVPTNVSAVLDDDGKARITWVDPTGGTASHVIRRGDTVVEEVAAPTAEAIEDVLPDERCFTVQAHVGDQFSEQSEPVCVGDDTEGGPVGPGGPRGPITGETSLGIVALPVSPGFGPASVDDPGGRTIAEGNRVDLFNLGFENAVLIVSTDYPELQPSLANASYLAVIPFFNTPQQALDACHQAQLECQTYAPGPLREGGPPPVSGPPT
jgi:Fibronectin type III domain